MMHTTRRGFLTQTGAAGLALLAAGRTARAAAKVPFKMGVQSYSFRNFKLEECMARAKQLGLSNIEFCSVHFPPAPDHPDFPAVRKAIADAGITPVCYGVEGFTDNHEANRVKFEFGKALGIEVLTADPTPGAFDSLDKLTEEYGIKIAIHNHGPGARYDSVEDTLRAVKDHSKMIGACVDTGHVIRSGEKPHEVIEALGDRVISMHLKDWVHKGEEQNLGEGDLDLTAVAKALRKLQFRGHVNLEYELHPDDPVPGMKIGLANWTAVLEEVYD
jgi:sugar phosphate isomerase/epimerase